MNSEQQILLARIEEVLHEARKTNGRVTKNEDQLHTLTETVRDLHEVVFGDHVRQTKGLVIHALESEELLREWRLLRKFLAGVGGLLTALAVPLIVAYLGG